MTGCLEEIIKAKDKTKLHLRPAQKIVETSQQFKAEMTFLLQGEFWNPKSILEMMMFVANFVASNQDEFIMQAKGEDAAEAFKAMANLFEELT